MTVATIQAEVLGLPEEERAKLIDVLWDSLSLPGIKAREAAWAAESERRLDAVEGGKLATQQADKLLSKLRKSLRK
jgi:putative addiction module component (TIGR02574 family)